MGVKDGMRPIFVIGPLGERLTLERLPPSNTTHWVVRRKAEVMAAVDGGLLDLDEACARYKLSIDELNEWRRAIDRAGMPGLRVTKGPNNTRKRNEDIGDRHLPNEGVNSFKE